MCFRFYITVESLDCLRELKINEFFSFRNSYGDYVVRFNNGDLDKIRKLKSFIDLDC